MTQESAAPTATGGPKKLTYTHDAMIDLILQEPTVTQDELGEIFGYSRNWIGRVINSDAFKARLAQRKSELVDPLIARSLNERMSTVAVKSLDIITHKLDAEQSASYAIEALGIVAGSVRKSPAKP